MSESISRKAFLKGAATTAMGAGVLSAFGTASASEAEAPADEAAELDTMVHLKGYCSDGSWLGEAPVVDEASITETIETDVVVIGGGHSGTLAALGAIDEGASVAVIEVQPWGAFVDLEGSGMNMGGWYGEDIGHVNSKWQAERGFGPFNTGEICYEFVKRTMGRCDPNLIKKYVQNSGAMFDRMCEIYNSYEDLRKEQDSAVMVNGELHGQDGVIVDFSDMLSYPLSVVHQQLDPDTEYPINVGDYKTWPANIQFYGHQGNNIEYFMKYIKLYNEENGATYYFEHRGVVLVQNENGDVEGVVAEDLNNPGTYKKFLANSGVVVAAGDFKGDPQMCWSLLNEYMEWAERNDMTLDDWATTQTRNGDGHKMMCWAGAMMEATPRGCMGKKSGPSGPWGAGTFLQLNSEGKRFYNEAGTATANGVMLRNEPGHSCFVTDSKVFEQLYVGGLDHGAPNFGWQEMYENMLATFEALEIGNPEGSVMNGISVAESMYRQSTVFAAETLEELGGFLGYEGEALDTFLASIETYNEMCNSEDGDVDYGKEKKFMFPIDEPPYYGTTSDIDSKPSLGLVTLSGVIADDEFRVARNGVKSDPIKGLYTCGNCLGNRYGLEYVTPMAGNSLGMAQTHGWLAGKNAAQGV